MCLFRQSLGLPHKGLRISQISAGLINSPLTEIMCTSISPAITADVYYILMPVISVPLLRPNDQTVTFPLRELNLNLERCDFSSEILFGV